MCSDSCGGAKFVTFPLSCSEVAGQWGGTISPRTSFASFGAQMVEERDNNGTLTGKSYVAPSWFAAACAGNRIAPPNVQGCYDGRACNIVAGVTFGTQQYFSYGVNLGKKYCQVNEKKLFSVFFLFHRLFKRIRM